MTTVEIPDEIAEQLEHRARAAGRNVDSFIREALIAQLEDLEDIEIAEELFAKGQTPIPIEQVIKDLGLDD